MGAVLSHACEVSCRVGARKCSVTALVTSPRARAGSSVVDPAVRGTCGSPTPARTCSRGTPGWAGLGVPGVAVRPGQVRPRGPCRTACPAAPVRSEHHGAGEETVRRRGRHRRREVAAPRPGDDLVPGADVVMDRGFDAPGRRTQVWPWLVQLGKRRGGWYLPRAVERFVPRSRRAARSVQPQWQGLRGRRRDPRLRRPGGVLRGGRGRARRGTSSTGPSAAGCSSPGRSP